MKNGTALEFPEDDGTFSLENYGEGTYFTVSSANQFQNQQHVSTRQENTPPAPPPLNASRRRSLGGVKIVRADIGANGKPENIHVHNHTVHVNLYSESEANVNHILHKVKEEMNDDRLVLVNNNCLEILDQEGTRGKYLLFQIAQNYEFEFEFSTRQYIIFFRNDLHIKLSFLQNEFVSLAWIIRNLVLCPLLVLADVI